MVSLLLLAHVFSAHAEVVPHIAKGQILFLGILRARGGSSELREFLEHKVKYSPRTRR